MQKEVYKAYIIKSQASRIYYIGYSVWPRKRLRVHNSKKCYFTKDATPWELVFVSEGLTINDVKKREKQMEQYSIRQIEKLIQSDKNHLK